MYRIDSDGSIAGAFTDGNPQTGQEGTVVPAEYLTELQETICLAIELAGLVLQKGNSHQLYDAIHAIAVGVAGAGSGPGSVPTTRLLSTTGLLIGGGDLSRDRILQVNAATAADVLAGIRNDAAITPAALAAAYTSGGNGDDVWDMLPSGRILQTGIIRTPAAEGIVTHDFPRPFPNRCRTIFFTPLNATASDRKDMGLQRVSVTTTGFTGFYQLGGGSTVNSIDGLDYLAIGE